MTSRERGSSVGGTPTARDNANLAGPTPRTGQSTGAAWMEGSPKRSSSVSRISTPLESSPARSSSVPRLAAAKSPDQEKASSPTDAKAEQALRNAFKQLPDWVIADVFSSLPTTASRSGQQQLARAMEITIGEEAMARAQASQATQRLQTAADVENQEQSKGDVTTADRLLESPPGTASTSATSSPNAGKRPETVYVNDQTANAVSGQVHS